MTIHLLTFCPTKQGRNEPTRSLSSLDFDQLYLNYTLDSVQKRLCFTLDFVQIEAGIKASQAIFDNKKSILSLPFYGIEALMKNDGSLRTL